MTAKELSEKLHEIARAGAMAAARHLAPELAELRARQRAAGK